MDMIPAGIQSLHGTSDNPYGGKRGQERWNKMRDNVVREWEEEQRKKNATSNGIDEVGNKDTIQTSDISKDQTNPEKDDGSTPEITTSQDKDRSKMSSWFRKKFGG